jgi:hypothetical protein
MASAEGHEASPNGPPVAEWAYGRARRYRATLRVSSGALPVPIRRTARVTVEPTVPNGRLGVGLIRPPAAAVATLAADSDLNCQRNAKLPARLRDVRWKHGPCIICAGIDAQ